MLPYLQQLLQYVTSNLYKLSSGCHTTVTVSALLANIQMYVQLSYWSIFENNHIFWRLASTVLRHSQWHIYHNICNYFISSLPGLLQCSYLWRVEMFLHRSVLKYWIWQQIGRTKLLILLHVQKVNRAYYVLKVILVHLKGPSGQISLTKSTKE